MKIHIVKIGGNVIDNTSELNEFLNDFAQLDEPKILVHGGGKIASELSQQMGLSPQFYNGRRITDKQSLDIAIMVYAGLINKTIVAKLQAYSCNAIGLSGADGNLIKAHKRNWPDVDVDFGYVGDVDSVNAKNLQLLLKSGFVPVFCALTHNQQGQLFNTNADTMASEIAGALASENTVKLTYCFEKNGVLTNVEDENSVIPKLTKQNFNALKQQNIIHSGMLPKLENCFAALERNVSQVSIGSPKIIKNNNMACTQII